MKTFYLLLFSVFVVQCQDQPKPSQATDLGSERFEQRVDSLTQAYVALDIFSGVVLVAKEGKPVYHKAFGMANRSKAIPNTTETRFDIGSMNKAFTKVLLLQLVHEGKLDLDDTIGEYLQGFPEEAASKITIRHLLNHRSGLRGYHEPEYWQIPYEERGIDTAVDFIRKLPLEFEPGTEQAYSNSGYVVAGKIAEVVTDSSYFDLVRSRIVDPLGLENTYLKDKRNVPRRAIGYYKNMRGELQSNEEWIEASKPDGGFYSTTDDIMRFYRSFHYGDEIWTDEIRELDERSQFYKEHMNSGGAMVHAGGFPGSNTVHYEILRDQISVVVFANADEVVAENLGAGILAIIRGEEPESPSLPAIQAVFKALTDQGADYIKENWDSLTRNYHPQDPKDNILNRIGYNLMEEGHVDIAVDVFELNTEMFPEVANVWDSYGEGLRRKGDTEAALEAYQKALEIRPNIPTAKQAVSELTAELENN